MLTVTFKPLFENLRLRVFKSAQPPFSYSAETVLKLRKWHQRVSKISDHRITHHLEDKLTQNAYKERYISMWRSDKYDLDKKLGTPVSPEEIPDEIGHFIAEIEGYTVDISE